MNLFHNRHRLSKSFQECLFHDNESMIELT